MDETGIKQLEASRSRRCGSNTGKDNGERKGAEKKGAKLGADPQGLLSRVAGPLWSSSDRPTAALNRASAVGAESVLFSILEQEVVDRGRRPPSGDRPRRGPAPPSSSSSSGPLASLAGN